MSSLERLLKRFWSKADCKGDGCWEWKAGKHKKTGYGVFSINNRQHPAHRVALELRLGEPIPDGMFACHRCDNPSCVRPDHLFLGTHLDNMRDMKAKGRHPRQSYKLSPEQVAAIRSALGSETQKSIAARYGVSPSCISLISSGINHRHG